MKMFAVVVAIFAFLTLPNNVRWLVDDFGNYNEYESKELVSFLCTMCTYFNCVANPIIYGTFSKDYKGSFLYVLSFGRYRNKYNLSASHAVSRHPSTIRSHPNRRSSNQFRNDVTGKERLGTMV